MAEENLRLTVIFLAQRLTNHERHFRQTCVDPLNRLRNRILKGITVTLNNIIKHGIFYVASPADVTK